MALNLSVLKSPAGVALTVTEKSFGENGGTIGRGESNDWVLGDPDRFLSSKHCSLMCENGQYILTDTSTNGTFINGSPEPVGKGGRIALNNGDTIEVGDYQFRVELSSAAPAEADPFSIPLEASDPFEYSAPLDNDDPFAPPTPTSDAAPLPPLSDPFGSSDALGGGDPFGSNDPFAASPDLSLSPDPLQVDPLAALDGAGQSMTPAAPLGGALTGAGDIIGGDFASNGGFPPSDFPGSDFPGNSTPQNPLQSEPPMPTHSDGANPLSQSVNWPEAKSDNLIPDDWDDLLGGSAPIAQAASPSAIMDDPFAAEIEQVPRSFPLTEPPQMPKSEAAPIIPADIPVEPVAAERVQTPIPAAQPQSVVPPPPPRPAQAPVQPQRPSEPQVNVNTQTNAGAPADFVAALVAGLNLEQGQIGEEDLTAIYQTIGEILPVIITGMMQVLRSRASIKNEFRMNVTTIQPIENNPLKFSADATEAFENMFTRKSGAYLGPKEAFQEGFDGIGEHQVAIIAGIRAGFKSMMDRFNPEQLEKQFDKQSKGVILPGMQKSKYWNSYSDYYKSYVDNMENTFQYLFGDEFVQAYEEQLRRLAAERKQRKKTNN